MKLNYSTIAVAARKDLPFSGGWVNVFVTENCLSNELMAMLARRLDQPESVFVCPASANFSSGDSDPCSETYNIKWFSLFGGELYPGGAGTMAAAHRLFELKPLLKELRFRAVGKSVEASRDVSADGGYATRIALPCKSLAPKVFDRDPEKTFYRGRLLHGDRDLYLILESEEELRLLSVDYARTLLEDNGFESLVVTAPGRPTRNSWVDFVYRVFLPGNSPGEIYEDPASLSVLSNLAPYWSQENRAVKLIAWQLSDWESEIAMELQEDQVFITDQCSTVGESTLDLSLLDPEGSYTSS